MTTRPHPIARASLTTCLLLLALAGFITLATPAPARASSPTDTLQPSNANWHLVLEDVWPAERRRGKLEHKNLDCFLNLVDGTMAAGVGYASRFNRSGHVVHKADIELKGNQFTIQLDMSLYPDRWIPEDGSVTPVSATLSGKLSSAEGGYRITGQYQCRVGGEKARGELSGQIMTRPKAENVCLPGRLFPVKIDDRDFPEMEFQVAIEDEKPTWGRIGMSWQRWPHRWHEFDASILKWDPTTQKLTGTVRVPGRAVDVACEPDLLCELTVDGAWIGNLFAGSVIARPAAGQTDDSFPERTFNGGQYAWENGANRQTSADDYCWLYEVDQDPWYVPSQSHEPVKPGEHPRLLFRKRDVPRIRERARTEHGRQIVQRLRKLLGHNGEKLPDRFNNTPAHNHNRSDGKQPLGTFTSFHAPGYAMLYQITGEQKYADLARGAVELMFKGRMDRDNRYGWVTPGTQLRAGSLLSSVALAYDLAYDGWDPDFRKKVALELQNYDHQVASGGRITIRTLLGRTGYPPSSNHYGSQFGGTTTAMLAILGDPGTDTDFVKARIAEGQWMIPHFLHFGLGEGGFYQEGPHPSRLSTNGGFLEMLQAMRNVTGRDYISARDHAQFATLRWVMWLIRDGAGRPVFTNRGTYGDDAMYGRAPMLSHSADFAYGFGSVEDKYKPALLWTYNNFVRTWEQGPARPWWVEQDEHSFNAFVYPHHAVHALVNWPIDIEPRNPASALPLHRADTVNDFFVSRNRWQDANDIVVTFSTGGGPWGYHRGQHRGSIMYFAHGTSVNLPAHMGHCKPYRYRVADDGSFGLDLYTYFFDLKRHSFVVDLSGQCGAQLAIVYAISHNDDRLRKGQPRVRGGNAVVQNELITSGDITFLVSTADTKNKPAIKANGNTITIGKTTYTYDGKTITTQSLKGESVAHHQ